jgi:hypothetical protein
MKLKELGFIEILTDDPTERAWMAAKGKMTVLVYRTLGTTIHRVEVSVGTKKTAERQFPNEAEAVEYLTTVLSNEVRNVILTLLVIAAITLIAAVVLYNA